MAAAGPSADGTHLSHPQSPRTPQVCLVSATHPWTPPNRYPSPRPSILFPVPLPSSPASLRLSAELEAHYADAIDPPVDEDTPTLDAAALFDQETWESRALQSLVRMSPCATADVIASHYDDDAPHDQLDEEEAWIARDVAQNVDYYYFLRDYILSVQEGPGQQSVVQMELEPKGDNSEGDMWSHHSDSDSSCMEGYDPRYLDSTQYVWW